MPPGYHIQSTRRQHSEPAHQYLAPAILEQSSNEHAQNDSVDSARTNKFSHLCSIRIADDTITHEIISILCLFLDQCVELSDDIVFKVLSFK